MAGVCSGLIIGSVDHIQHRTKALISAMSHLFFFPLFFLSLCSIVCIYCYRAHDWLSLMAICHASDGVPKRFQRQRSSFKKSRTRRMQGSFCCELAGGGFPRVPLIPPTTYQLTPTTHPSSLLWRFGNNCSAPQTDGWPESVKRVAPATWFRYAPWSHYINVLQWRDFLSLVVLNLEGQRHRIASDQLLVHLLKIFQQDDVSLSLLLT